MFRSWFSRRWLGVILVVVLVSGFAAYAIGGNSYAVLRTASGDHRIDVEIADTPDERATGLMNRNSMPADHGMLFEFGESRPVTMWMKNTLIPLDMLFMDEDGKVTRIAVNARPLSLALIPSGEPVRYVLELNGGAAARYGAAVGDQLIHPAIQGE
ncbi:DUF192 domain-containing protein [Consotaella aegiceratis]|uniref:DUF192 domain-containing protein n=1 Tax=Consotaella aegiceratis TaxID=3097961 RepID=UPI002F42D388